MHWVSLTLLTFLATLHAGQSAPNIFDLDLSNFFSFPEVRRGRGISKGALPVAEKKPTGSVSVAKNAGEEANVLASLIDAVMREVVGDKKSLELANGEKHIPVEVIEDDAFEPRNVDHMQDFGSRLGDFQEAEEPAMDLENLKSDRFGFLRQTDSGVTEAPEEADDDEIRCIQKVMQVEETVYDRAIKCHHSYQEKCHMTYITDYQSSTEEKCETTFKKNCHITFRPMPFNETVRVCHNPLVRTCSNETQGPDICNTYYETNCETSYKTYEVEQDEPICKMELMKKCDNVTINVPEDLGRQSRQEDDDGSTPNVVTVDQKCEEWPVQTCKLEKKKVKKVHPDTACRKIPREVCVPNNCAMAPGEEVCRDESRMQVQNVPQEECELQPEETCHMEAVLVPRLVPQPNCVKVPKEICVNSKTNPRVVKKPVIKDWCYRPSELKETPEVIPPTGPESGSGFFF